MSGRASPADRVPRAGGLLPDSSGGMDLAALAAVDRTCPQAGQAARWATDWFRFGPGLFVCVRPSRPPSLVPGIVSFTARRTEAQLRRHLR